MLLCPSPPSPQPPLHNIDYRIYYWCSIKRLATLILKDCWLNNHCFMIFLYCVILKRCTNISTTDRFTYFPPSFRIDPFTTPPVFTSTNWKLNFPITRSVRRSVGWFVGQYVGMSQFSKMA